MIQTKNLDCPSCGAELLDPIYDLEMVDGGRRRLTCGECGRPFTVTASLAHADLWAKDGAHAAGLWRFPEVLSGDVMDFRPPMPVSADEMRQWAKSTADLLRLGFGAMDEKEARRWSTPPSL